MEEILTGMIQLEVVKKCRIRDGGAVHFPVFFGFKRVQSAGENESAFLLFWKKRKRRKKRPFSDSERRTLSLAKGKGQGDEPDPVLSRRVKERTSQKSSMKRQCDCHARH